MLLFNGRLLHIHVAPAASYEMEELEEANLVAGRESKATEFSRHRNLLGETGLSGSDVD